MWSRWFGQGRQCRNEAAPDAVPDGSGTQENAKAAGPAATEALMAGHPSAVLDIEALLHQIASPDPADWHAASSTLSRLSEKEMMIDPGEQEITVLAGEQALRAAAQPFPERNGHSWDWSEKLLRAVAAEARPEYIPLLVDLFPRFSERAKTHALYLLAKLDEREAAEGYITVAREHARTGGLPFLVTQPLLENPRHAELFFPALMEYADVPHLAFNIGNLCLRYFQAGLLTPERMQGFAEPILAAYTALEVTLQAAQQASGVSWMWEEAYWDARVRGALFLDLLGYFPEPEVGATLQRALEYSDPRLKCVAATALIRHGAVVSPAQLRAVAASPEMRLVLYSYLCRLGQEALYPQEFHTQAAIAEAHMVRWLSFPGELGQAPDAIECMSVVSADAGPPHGMLDWYLFRYRCDEPEEDTPGPWLAGVSGPYLRNDAPAFEGGEQVFSTFEEWESKTPEEYLGEVAGWLDLWRSERARRDSEKVNVLSRG